MIKPAMIYWNLTEALNNRSHSAIAAVKKGYSPMEYMSKTQRIKISALNEIFHGQDVDQNYIKLVKEPSKTNLADAFTKELPREAFELLRDTMGILEISRLG